MLSTYVILQRILRISAEIGHYIGDAHVPLHTTENYNGQLSGQEGIHAFWESRLPEMFSDEFDFFVGTSELYHESAVYGMGSGRKIRTMPWIRSD